MFSKFVFALFFCAFSGSLALVTEEYCWKEYRGQIPDDAIQGGTSATGKPIYIGQVLYFDKLLPAKIYKDDEKAYFAWNHEISATTNIKILCSPKPQNFKWIPTSKDEIHHLTDHHVVSGGFEHNYNIYIGRALYKSETTVGKVRNGEKAGLNLGLSITSEGKVANVDTFEILTYKPESSTEIRHCNKKVVIINH